MGFLQMVHDELARARVAHGPIQTAHEGWAVIFEELDEFWDLVRLKKEERDPAEMLKELIQTAAMCQRTAEDLGLV